MRSAKRVERLVENHESALGIERDRAVRLGRLSVERAALGLVGGRFGLLRRGRLGLRL
jgi:hypothetical protein